MKILVQPRVHFSLISMHDGGYRKNGGIGLALREPTGVLTFSTSNEFSFVDCRDYPFSMSEVEKILNVLREAKRSSGLAKSMDIRFEGQMRTHYGMGSGTAARLACLEALFLLNDTKCDRHQLVELSGRGGTSGIGIHSYFSGKFVFDLGVRNRSSDFYPSSRSASSQKPLLLDAVDYPSWKVGLCIPNNVKPKTQAEEVEFFEKTCPLDVIDTCTALYHSLLGAYASVKENDINGFALAMREIQGCTWKRKERSEYGQELTRLEDQLYDCGALCVGMSSLGPSLFYLATEEKFQAISGAIDGRDCALIETFASNSGRKVLS